jgi:hypothetical protein
VFERAASLWRRLTRKPAHAHAAAEDDRRVWVRRHVSVETQVAAADGGPATPARIVDVSSGGVQLRIGRDFEAGELLTLELPSRAGEPPATVLACVAHTRPDGDSGWVIGCRFSAKLSDADLSALGAGRSRSALPDSRNWSRNECKGKAAYRIVPDDGEAPREAKVLNISPGGVALLVEGHVPTGALLSTELLAPDGRTVVTILACVVHVAAPSERERVLGCNFIREIGDEELKALG